MSRRSSLLSSALASSTLLLIPSPLVAQFACLPSCPESDARFLSILGPALGGSSSWTLNGTLALPPSAKTVELGVFDGDSGGQWDSRDGLAPLLVELYEDPLANGTGEVRVGRWLGTSMPDNAWADLEIPTGPGARAPSGAFFYRLVIRAPVVSAIAWANFKLRVPVTSELLIGARQRLILTAGAFHLADLRIVYPHYPDIEGSPYDGEWRLSFLMPNPLLSLEVWDGDLDYGAADCSTADTDDPNTPPAIPSWDPQAQAEGVGAGEIRDCGVTTGANADESDFRYFSRSPSIFYSVHTPAGGVFRNRDPSGNAEWERFRLSSGADPEADVEHVALTAGAYHVRLRGADLSNAFSFYLPGPLVAICDIRGLTLCSPHFTP